MRTEVVSEQTATHVRQQSNPNLTQPYEVLMRLERRFLWRTTQRLIHVMKHDTVMHPFKEGRSGVDSRSSRGQHPNRRCLGSTKNAS